MNKSRWQSRFALRALALLVFWAAFTRSDPTAPSIRAASAAVRPSYNKGVGFFVLNGKLYDANGNEFRIRGINKVHWDNDSPGLANSHANAARWVVDFTRTAGSNVALLLGSPTQPTKGTVADKMVVMPGNWDGTCSTKPSDLTAIVDTWVAQASTWAQPAFEKYSIINIANEWGPAANISWRTQYLEAIARLRAAGYHATISVTSGGCGQDVADLLQYAQSVFDSDPEKNVIFDLHVYGQFSDAAGGAPPTDPGQTDLTSAATALAQTGLVVILGEFGPGRNIGPSPTPMTPTRVVQIAEQAGLGWIAWAWDDNNLPNAMADDNWFALSYSGNYDSSADLTIFGKAVVEDPVWGLKRLASPASLFTGAATVPAAPPAALALLAMVLLGAAIGRARRRG